MTRSRPPQARMLAVAGVFAGLLVLIVLRAVDLTVLRGPELAPALAASAWSPAPGGELVEALEGRDPGRFILGVQSHPERTESTPPEFERLFRFFVDAAWHTTRGIAVTSTSPASR